MDCAWYNIILLLVDHGWIRYMCSGYTGGGGGGARRHNSSVRLDHLLRPEAQFLLNPVTPSVGGNNFPLRMHLSHTWYTVHLHTVKILSLIFFRIAGLRTPAPDSESGVSVLPPARRGSVPSPIMVLPSGKPPTGLHVLPPYRQGSY